MPVYLLITQKSGTKKTLEDRKSFWSRTLIALGANCADLKSKGKGMDGENSIHELFPFNNLQDWERKVEVWTGDLIWHPDQAFREKE